MIDLGRARAVWAACDVTVRDLPLALAVAATPLVPALHHQGTQLGGLPNRPVDALAVVAVVLQSFPLAVRRRWPSLCLLLVSLGFAVDQLRGYHTVTGVALPIAVFSAAAHLRERRRATAVVASVAYVTLVAALVRAGATEGPSDFVTFYLVLVVSGCIGAWLRQTRSVEEENRRRLAETTRAGERALIARELHDVVTHHVTAMVVQAESARYVTAHPARLDEALTAVTDTGRRAIDDLRNLLDVLDPGHGPQPRTPGVGEIDALVEQARQAGQPVELLHEGSPPLVPGTAEVAAYRVVQEALTNALKHARGSRTLVRVRHGDDALDVEVTTDGPASPRVSPDGSGRGLIGLRERVGLLGGGLSASPEPGGVFVVRAQIPTGPRR
ncbi:sensor histidine kinase [Cellulomonas composti]|uniref:histidine kinase n=1 Tax=Cellulomonas composti TaxID=266130 RepID=A0A511J7U3_9CELL|nr:histidine kinase [Cellulomonas composti]GEL94061.1 two-component sensor histidine kinase [Cellulomonas composti]